MLSRNLEQSLHRALNIAGEYHHEFATLEHLLLSLIEDPDAISVLRACEVDLDKVHDDVVNFLENELVLPPLDGMEDPKPTSGFQRVIQRAIIHVQSSGREEVTGANVLVALFSERESHAVFFLQEQDVTRLDAVNYISHGIAKAAGLGEDRHVAGAGLEPGLDDDDEGTVKTGREALEAYCVNLNDKAESGKIDPLIGRADEVDRTIQVLCRRTKNNPLYVGDPGVGKTAIAEGLARRIHEGDVPEVLLDGTNLGFGHGDLAGGHALSRRF